MDAEIRWFTLGYITALAVELAVKWVFQNSQATVINFPASGTASTNGSVSSAVLGNLKMEGKTT